MTIIRPEDLEIIAARGWQATTQVPLGQWLLRAGSGFTGRANSVLPIGSPGMPLDQALSVVTEFYHSHRLPPLFQVAINAGPTQDELDRQLAIRGWTSFNRTSVMVSSIATISGLNVIHRQPIALADRPDARWLRGYQYRGAPLPDTAIDVLTNASGVVFAALGPPADPDPWGVARGVITDDWLGITAVTVAKSFRRQGLGTQLMGELARWAGRQGVRFVYLQVDDENSVAHKMYRAQGFIRHHGYHYRRRALVP